jgi:hypothetical protein
LLSGLGYLIPEVGDHQVGCNTGTDMITELVRCEGMGAETEKLRYRRSRLLLDRASYQVERLLRWVLLVLILVLESCYAVHGRLVVTYDLLLTLSLGVAFDRFRHLGWLSFSLDFIFP